MNQNYKTNTGSFAEYLQTLAHLDALERITNNLDEELMDSQRVMREIETMFKSIPKAENTNVNNESRHEDLSKFLEADVPKLLMPDMAESTIDVDLDDVIATMKGYAEDLKKNFVFSHTQTQPRNIDKNVENLDLDQYASSLDQLSKRLANIKLNKKDEENNKNVDLENKLTQLCQDVNMFTQMVQAKTTLSQCNENWTGTQQDDNALHYDNIINKLLSGINEVTYLLQNRN